jgi:hypothetical protein
VPGDHPAVPTVVAGTTEDQNRRPGTASWQGPRRPRCVRSRFRRPRGRFSPRSQQGRRAPAGVLH